MQIRSPLVSIVLIFILFITTLVVPIGGIIHSGGAGVAAAANTPTPTPAPSPATRNSSQNLTSIEVSAGDISQNKPLTLQFSNATGDNGTTFNQSANFIINLSAVRDDTSINRTISFDDTGNESSQVLNKTETANITSVRDADIEVTANANKSVTATTQVTIRQSLAEASLHPINVTQGEPLSLRFSNMNDTAAQQYTRPADVEVNRSVLAGFSGSNISEEIEFPDNTSFLLVNQTQSANLTTQRNTSVPVSVNSTVTTAVNVTIRQNTTSTPTSTPPPQPTPAAASSCNYPIERTDATGETLRFEEPPKTVVSLSPSAAQTMWEIDAESKVIGVSPTASYLEGARSKQTITVFPGVDIETVVGLQPELVLAPNVISKDDVEALRSNGMTVYRFEEGTSLEFVAEKTELTGALVGQCDAADDRADELRDDVDDIEDALDDEPTQTGLYFFFGFTAGSDTFIGDIIQTGGISNGAAEQGISGFKEINDETVVAIDPAWIITDGDDDDIPDNDAYESTRAVQNDQIIEVNSNYINQPAPRTIQAVETILSQVHPDAYTEYTTGVDPSEGGSGGGKSSPTKTAEPQITKQKTDVGVKVSIDNTAGADSVSVPFSAETVDEQLDEAGTAVESIAVSMDGPTEADLSVSSHSSTDPPESSTAPTSSTSTANSVYSYLTLDYDGNQSVISSATVSFRVDESRLQSTDPTDITLYRASNGKWQPLETNHVGGERFIGITPGFSVFAVATQNPAQQTSTSTLTPSTETSQTVVSETPTSVSTEMSSETQTTVPTSQQVSATPVPSSDNARPSTGVFLAGGVLTLLVGGGMYLIRRHDLFE